MTANEFVSVFADEEIDAIPLPVKEGRNNLWAKTKESFKYIYDNHLNEYDWFLKADDDTYIIVENLRFMLYPYAAETPIYFGCRFKPFVKQVCMRSIIFCCCVISLTMNDFRRATCLEELVMFYLEKLSVDSLKWPYRIRKSVDKTMTELRMLKLVGKNLFFMLVRCNGILNAKQASV